MSRFAQLSLLAASLAPALQAQSTWYVDVSAPAPGSGTQSSPYRSIQFAIDAASTVPGDTLSIASGTYYEALDLNGKALRFFGDPMDRPRLHAASGGSVVRIDSGEGPGIEFQDVVFTGGTGSVGGAVFLDRESARFTHCSFEDNHACASGGAIASLGGGDVTLVNCTFLRNRAHGAGAIHIGSGTLSATGCTFEANEATQLNACTQGNQRGGAIYVTNASAELLHCTFRDNVSPETGGAVYLDNSFIGHRVEFCVFERNGRRQGATITPHAGALKGIDATVRDCQFFDNHARGNGGAVVDGTYIRCTFERNSANAGGAAYSARLEDCIVRWNNALESGGNPSAGGGTHSSEHLRTVLAGNTSVNGAGACANSFGIDRCTLIGNVGRPSNAAANANFVRNSIVWGNRSSWPGQPATQLSGTVVTYSLVEGQSGGLGNISGLPLLFGEHVGDAHLLPGSPAIDAADPTLPLDPDGSRADMGALTFDPFYRTEPARFCAAKTTSLGCVPEIDSIGTPSLGAAIWHVQVSGAPLGTLGLVLLATSTADTPFFGGRLCLGGPIVRAVPANALPATGCGDVLAFTMPPASISATGALAGDLLFAQVWFRDSAHPDGSGVGISDALVVTVQP